MQETVILNTQDQKRVLVLNRILEGQVSSAEATALLKLSKRKVQQILATSRKEGAAALVHGNRRRQPIHPISEQTRQQILSLAQTTYAGANQRHLRDVLEERDGIVVSRASVRRIAQSSGQRGPKQPQYRRCRKRYAQEGMLMEIDCSPHAWLEDRYRHCQRIAAEKNVIAIFPAHAREKSSSWNVCGTTTFKAPWTEVK